MELKYNDDESSRNSKCMNCGKVLEIKNSRTNKYFCNFYCTMRFTSKARKEGKTVKEKIKEMGCLCD